MVAIRAASPQDAPCDRRVHVGVWRWAYRGHAPRRRPGRLPVERRERDWRPASESRPRRPSVIVADDGGRLVGFASTATSRDDDAPPGTGEVLRVYVVEDAVGRRAWAGALIARRAGSVCGPTGTRVPRCGSWRPNERHAALLRARRLAADGTTEHASGAVRATCRSCATPSTSRRALSRRVRVRAHDAHDGVLDVRRSGLATCRCDRIENSAHACSPVQPHPSRQRRDAVEGAGLRVDRARRCRRPFSVP